jgi:hypothetical protein
MNVHELKKCSLLQMVKNKVSSACKLYNKQALVVTVTEKIHLMMGFSLFTRAAYKPSLKILHKNKFYSSTNKVS